MNEKQKVALCTLEQEMTADQLAEKYGSPTSWGEHPIFDRQDWQYEVEEGNTIQGYWAWVSSEIDRFVSEIEDD